MAAQPIVLLPVSIPATTSCVFSSQSHNSLIVNGVRLITFALPALSKCFALAGLQGIKGFPFLLITYTYMALSLLVY